MEINRSIVIEIYRAFVLLGAESDLLGNIGSWGDSLPDDQVLNGLRTWNNAKLTDIKARIEHYEIAHPR